VCGVSPENLLRASFIGATFAPDTGGRKMQSIPPPLPGAWA
jgi:hypothetical protein